MIFQKDSLMCLRCPFIDEFREPKGWPTHMSQSNLNVPINSTLTYLPMEHCWSPSKVISSLEGIDRGILCNKRILLGEVKTAPVVPLISAEVYSKATRGRNLIFQYPWKETVLAFIVGMKHMNDPASQCLSCITEKEWIIWMFSFC